MNIRTQHNIYAGEIGFNGELKYKFSLHYYTTSIKHMFECFKIIETSSVVMNGTVVNKLLSTVYQNKIRKDRPQQFRTNCRFFYF